MEKVNLLFARGAKVTQRPLSSTGRSPSVGARLSSLVCAVSRNRVASMAARVTDSRCWRMSLVWRALAGLRASGGSGLMMASARSFRGVFREAVAEY